MNVICVINIECVITNFTQFYVLSIYEDPFHVHFVNTVQLIRKFSRFIFSSFVKIKPSLNGKITLSFTDVGKSCPNCEYLT